MMVQAYTAGAHADELQQSSRPPLSQQCTAETVAHTLPQAAGIVLKLLSPFTSDAHHCIDNTQVSWQAIGLHDAQPKNTKKKKKLHCNHACSGSMSSPGLTRRMQSTIAARAAKDMLNSNRLLPTSPQSIAAQLGFSHPLGSSGVVSVGRSIELSRMGAPVIALPTTVSVAQSQALWLLTSVMMSLRALAVMTSIGSMLNGSSISTLISSMPAPRHCISDDATIA